MGQTSIPFINKTGYSMFWSSMWDQKILYSRFLKEDIFLNKFFEYSFNDSFSINFLNFKRKDIQNFKKYNYDLDLKKPILYKFILNKNKIDYIPAKLWIIRYQKWVIIYQFIFLTNLKKNVLKDENDFFYKNSFNYILKYYNLVNINLNVNYQLNKKYNNYVF